MSVEFPTNTIILIVTLLFGAGLAGWLGLTLTLNRLSIAPQVKRNWSLGVGAVLLAWFIARLAVAINPPGGAVLGTPYVVVPLVATITIGLLLPRISPVYRQFVRTIPQTWLIGIHIFRVVGGFFLVLMDMKLLPGEFALPAGYGDVITAVLALGVVYLLVNQKPYARAAVIAWNVFGLIDLINALITGTMFIPPFVTQVAASGVSPAYINYALMIPSFGVPLVLILHFYSLYRLFSPHQTIETGKVQTEPTPLQPASR
jgi:hypothetical protein